MNSSKTVLSMCCADQAQHGRFGNESSKKLWVLEAAEAGRCSRYSVPGFSAWAADLAGVGLLRLPLGPCKMPLCSFSTLTSIVNYFFLALGSVQHCWYLVRARNLTASYFSVDLTSKRGWPDYQCYLRRPSRSRCLVSLVLVLDQKKRNRWAILARSPFTWRKVGD